MENKPHFLEVKVLHYLVILVGNLSLVALTKLHCLEGKEALYFQILIIFSRIREIICFKVLQIRKKRKMMMRMMSNLVKVVVVLKHITQTQLLKSNQLISTKNHHMKRSIINSLISLRLFYQQKKRNPKAMDIFQ